MRVIDITGNVYSRLTVLEYLGGRKGRAMWKCKCQCGNIVVVPGKNLRNGRRKSCGCLRHEELVARNQGMAKHNMSQSRLHKTWSGMKSRCYYENDISYKLYGGRGIRVCDEWKDDFIAFRDWALSHGYRENLTIDRIDTNGNYEPRNCRWATVKEQANNRRSSHFLTMNGETKTIQQWSDELGIKDVTIHARLKNGWGIEKALTEKPLKRGAKNVLSV